MISTEILPLHYAVDSRISLLQNAAGSLISSLHFPTERFDYPLCHAAGSHILPLKIQRGVTSKTL
jgi:hypothetical protein